LKGIYALKGEAVGSFMFIDKVVPSNEKNVILKWFVSVAFVMYPNTE